MTQSLREGWEGEKWIISMVDLIKGMGPAQTCAPQCPLPVATELEDDVAVRT